jgi:hypothetical protein
MEDNVFDFIEEQNLEEMEKIMRELNFLNPKRLIIWFPFMKNLKNKNQ